ncbi:DUF5667 domain-containing protein [Blastococcus sp. SYSU D00820]
MTPDDGAAPGGTRRAVVRDREEALVGRLERLATELDDAPDPAFRAATRARLVAMAAVRQPEADPAPERRTLLRRVLAVRADDDTRPSRWRTRLTAGLAGAAVAVCALGTLVALSSSAEPGDVLYDLKRGTEQTQLALAGDDRGATLLEFAGTRLDELADLAASGAPGDLVVQTLQTMDAQTAEGAALLVEQALTGIDPAPVQQLADWTARQSAELAELAPELPGEATAEAGAAADLLAAVAGRVAAVQGALACPTGPVSTGRDDLGPVPAPCAPATPAPAPAPDPAAPGGGTTAPSTSGAPVPTPAPAPQAPPAPGAPPAGPTSGTGPGGGGAQTGGSTGSGGGTAPATPTAPAPQPPRNPLPLPVPGGSSSTPTPTPTTPTIPPLIDTPLPICIPLVIC